MAAPQAVRAVVRLVLAVPPLWLIGSLAASSTIAAPVRAAIVAVSVLALIAPAEGLLVVALLAPLGELVGMGMMTPIRFAEAVVVAFFAGWLLRPVFARRIGPSPPAAIEYAAWGLAAIVLASIAVQALQIHATAPPVWSNYVWMLSHSYFDVFGVGDPFGAISGARLLEGIGLSAAVIALFRTKPMLANWIPEALGTGCVLAVAAALLLLQGIAFPTVLARHALIGSRFAAHVADVNAAGSQFALILCLSAGMSAREQGSKRAWWALVVVSALIGLWLCGSKSAAAAAVTAIAAVAVWLSTRRWSRVPRLALIAVVAIVIGVGSLMQDRQNAPRFRAAGFRSQFTETTLRLLRAHPAFGIGIGRYYPDSPMFLTPRLGFAYGGENAHNYFLQIAAEIGLAGFAACVVLLVGTLWLVARSLSRAPDDYRLIGLSAGVAAFLLTCLTGHPLLVNEVAYPFWIAAGLLLALVSPVPAERAAPQAARSLRRRLVLAAAVALVAASTPIRARESPLRVRHTREIEGLYEWEDGPDGRRYRWTEPYASVFVEGNPAWVVIPMRAPVAQWGDAPADVGIAVDGNRPATVPVGDDWKSIRIELPPIRFPGLNLRRINIRTEPARSVIDPAGSRPRAVGVQVGETVVPTGAAP